jgi:UDP-2,3-diacylglucosamine pyrophosphatase LpxH
MIVCEYRIPYTLGQTITLKPLFDVHLGNRYCDVSALKKYLSDADESTYLIGGGDILDSIIAKDVKRYVKHADACESDAIIDEQVEKAYDLLKPLNGRIIGLGTGNHESVISKYHGTHPMRRLCKMLGTTSLGFSWMVVLRFREQNGRGRTLTIRGHHGWGGGSRTQGADLTKYSKDMAYWDADMFLYGHVHKRQSDKIDRMSVVGTKLLAKPKYIYLCGTFLKTYSLTDEATYSEEKGYPPVSIGGINILLKPDREWLTVESDV